MSTVNFEKQFILTQNSLIHTSVQVESNTIRFEVIVRLQVQIYLNYSHAIMELQNFNVLGMPHWLYLVS